ncbi:MAG: hypothetical protein H6842_13445 [Rhodospirillaceae bacterium]|nr:hypothetical protein [Rhodospirillaceae bacterium]
MHARSVLKAVTAAAVVAGVATAAIADNRPPNWGPLSPSVVQGIPTLPGGILTVCTDPGPQQITFSSGTINVPYHGLMPAVIVHGAVINHGPVIYQPANASQTAQLWIRWGNNAPQQFASVPLTGLGINEWQQFTGAIAESDYETMFGIYGAPQITLKVVTTQGDCHTGPANQMSVVAPPPQNI